MGERTVTRPSVDGSAVGAPVGAAASPAAGTVGTDTSTDGEDAAAPSRRSLIRSPLRSTSRSPTPAFWNTAIRSCRTAGSTKASGRGLGCAVEGFLADLAGRRFHTDLAPILPGGC